MKYPIIWLVFISFGIVFVNAQKQAFIGKVISIKDGDTFKILYKRKEITIRLAHIDCPEKKQPFGTKAKQCVSTLCFGKDVLVKPNGKTDRYGRIIGEVFVKQQNINQELIKKGLAWHFKKYSSNEIYHQLEMNARRRKVGIWNEKTPIAPWEWRKRKWKK